MSITNIHDAKTNLSKLIEAALRGEEVVIAKAGKPVVRLVAIAAQPEEKVLTPGEKLIGAMGALKGKWEGPTDEEWAESDRYVLELFEESLNKE
ncbi:MAG: type II toxin-antitoxin system Phd/YefM family antitoxin [Beijerinckiaceae bacterium]